MKENIGYQTKETALIFFNKEKQNGCVIWGNFSMENVLDAKTNDEHYFGVDMSLIASFEKFKHAFVLTDLNDNVIDTFIEIKDIPLLLIEDLKNQTIHVVETDVEGNELESLLKNEGIQGIQSWFEEDNSNENILSKTKKYFNSYSLSNT